MTYPDGLVSFAGNMLVIISLRDSQWESKNVWGTVYDLGIR